MDGNLSEIEKSMFFIKNIIDSDFDKKSKNKMVVEQVNIIINEVKKNTFLDLIKATR